MKKFLAMVLSIMIINSFGISVSAEPDLDVPEQNEVIEDYQYTSRLNSNISISNKTATCKSTVTGFSDTATKIVITQTLQKKSGSSWTSVTSWTKTFNTWYGIYTTSKSSLSSGTYRLKTVAKVYKGSAYETITIYSSTASC